MSSHIHTWTDGHLALRIRAYETRGLVELNPGTTAATRWPRTTCSDVIAIAALFDPAVRANGTLGIVRRWRATLADLARDALDAATETYPENRAFWSTLETISIYLDDVAVTPPAPELWDALLDHLGTFEPRNVGPSGDGPFQHFDNIKTYDDLYIAQSKLLREKRGADDLDPPAGATGGKRPIPRTTNADVIQLATYWTNELAKVKPVMGRDAVLARWHVVLADIDKLAKPGKPDAVYAKNNELWREVGEVAIHVAASDEAPTRWDIAIDSVKDTIFLIPENLSKAASHASDVVAGAAHAVGKAANEAGKGFLAGLGAPLLIGAGLLGVFLISRHRSHEEA